MATRFFVPILAGATLRERAIACVGTLIAVAATGTVCGWVLGGGSHLPLIVAPIGASAVLVFAVPASPLAQPWPVVGGNTISALIGVTVAYFVHDQVLATGLAVSVAIAVMSLTRCLHPPGGAAALTAALGGPAVAATGFAFPLFPVGVNSLLLVAMGIGFHRLARRNYPHVAIPPAATHGTLDPPAQIRAGIRPEDIDAALSALDETYDISRDDIDRLLQEVEVQALMRKSDGLRCGDIMSKDVVKAEEAMPIEEARQLLLDHNIRILPVLDGDGRLTGTVGLRELAGATGTVADVRSHAATATSDHPAILLAPMLTDGRAHAVVIVDAECHVVGLITQTDLLAAVIRLRTSQTFPKD